MLREPTATPGLSSPEHAPDHLGQAFLVRMHKAAARLENEARRMLHLEAELNAFAHAYYDAVGSASERLTALEQQLEFSMPELVPHPPQTDTRAARTAELKRRYRHLAKAIHPDRGGAVDADSMHRLNAAYRQGDLAGLLRMEAHRHVMRLVLDKTTPALALEHALRAIDRAADTYASGYRTLAHSPLHELMRRAKQSRLAGGDWVQAVVHKLERTIAEKERMLAMQGIGRIAAWKDAALHAA